MTAPVVTAAIKAREVHSRSRQSKGNLWSQGGQGVSFIQRVAGLGSTQGTIRLLLPGGGQPSIHRGQTTPRETNCTQGDKPHSESPGPVLLSVVLSAKDGRDISQLTRCLL